MALLQEKNVIYMTNDCDLQFAQAINAFESDMPFDSDRASRIAGDALEQDPEQFRALIVMAVSQYRSGDIPDAAKYAQAAIDANPRSEIGYRLHSRILREQGALKDAIVCLESALPNCDESAALWKQIGQLRVEARQHVLAEEAFERARELNRQRSGHFPVASGTANKDRVDPAETRKEIEELWRQVDTGEASPEVHLRLGELVHSFASTARQRIRLKERRLLLTQAEHCLSVAAEAGASEEVFLELGYVRYRLGLFEQAEAAFRSAVEKGPQTADKLGAALTALGNILLEKGDVEGSVEMLERALRLAPDHGGANYRFARAKKFRDTPASRDFVIRLQALSGREDLAAQQGIEVNSALGKVLDDIGRHDEAWKHYDLGNRLKPHHSESLRPARRRRPASIDKSVDANVATFTTEFIESLRDASLDTQKPVFIVGMPRSGTTLTEQILSAHREIFGAGELREISMLRGEVGDLCSSCGGYPAGLVQADADGLRELASEYLGVLESMSAGEPRVTDKMPTNFLHLGLIAGLFPNAHIIHCQRHPLDVCVSAYCQNLDPPFCDLKLLAAYFKQYQRLMKHWESVVPMKIHPVRYESMVANTEQQCRQMIDFLGLDWDENCLNFQNNQRSVHTPSKWQVRQPIYKSSVSRWKRFDRYLTPLKEALGLDADGNPLDEW